MLKQMLQVYILLRKVYNERPKMQPVMHQSTGTGGKIVLSQEIYFRELKL